MDLQKKSASEGGSSDPTLQQSEMDLSTTPTTTSMAKAESDQMDRHESSVSDHHQEPADTNNTMAVPSLQIAAHGSLSIRQPPATNPGMPPSSPTPSVLSQSNQATSLLGLGLSQQTCNEAQFSTQSQVVPAQQSMAPLNQLGNLHKRRAEASPEKFNTGQFEPLQPQALTSQKRIRTEDGTPRDVVVENAPLQRTQLTAFLSDFNLTPRVSERYSEKSRIQNALSTGHSMPATPHLRPPLTSELTAGLGQFSFATPKAYTIPLSAIPPTPKAKPKRTIKAPFNLIHAFCANNELLLLLTSYLTIPSLISLYAISKVYHHQFNCHYTAHILAIMRTWAPRCDVIFPWRNYADLCIKDPKLRQNARLKDAKKTSEYSDLRDVPTIRWLQMVVYRHGVCTDMLIRLASYGHRCPAGTLDALQVRVNHPSTTFSSVLTQFLAPLVPP